MCSGVRMASENDAAFDLDGKIIAAYYNINWCKAVRGPGLPPPIRAMHICAFLQGIVIWHSALRNFHEHIDDRREELTAQQMAATLERTVNSILPHIYMASQFHADVLTRNLVSWTAGIPAVAHLRAVMGFDDSKKRITTFTVSA